MRAQRSKCHAYVGAPGMAASPEDDVPKPTAYNPALLKK
jgi:hypothetical protein